MCERLLLGEPGRSEGKKEIKSEKGVSVAEVNQTGIHHANDAWAIYVELG